MNKKQAIKLMKLGYKLTHRLFKYNEFITINKLGCLIDETGQHLSNETFWKTKQHTPWNRDWRMFNRSSHNIFNKKKS